MSSFSTVLVANRGEIAIRVFRTLRELGLRSVAVYSDAERGARHVAAADEAFSLGGETAAESYLVVEKLLDAARATGAEAVHPGYGFLAENARFARAVEAAGLVWIGPPAEAIELMGHKTAARTLMRDAGVPIIPGTTDPVASADEIVGLGDEIGYPLIVKAAAGGGGKGMRIVESPAEAERAFESASREGQAYFSDPSVYVERYLENPRHVEVQVLADAHGNVIHLGERDCTIQRRHQKLIEETPSPAVDDELRERIGAIAVEAARAVGYRSAGTIEGLLAPDGSYYFMEMNTRLQVEHTVTEEVTGLDLVREQIRIAQGEPLSLRQEDVVLRGHAIECRINAEDVSKGFLPAPGRIAHYREPTGPGVRVDSGVAEGSEISPLYDPMIAKLIVRDVDRERARRRMLRALGEFEIEGVQTLLGFHRALLEHPCFVAGETCHGVVESDELARRAEEHVTESHKVGHGPGGRLDGRTTSVEVDGRRYDVTVLEPEPPWAELARARAERSRGGGAGGSAAVISPMQGTVLSVGVEEGETVEAGRVLCVVEAMKMENEITAHRAGVVTELSVGPGQSVQNGQVICLLAQGDDGA
ncbi:MAG TPA: acetyl-CoA carboxylase biotin carboxylase subunit [Gaiellaceae bacterium]|nr:acetyl-CoA carboxylase biotin carboxylase subunit [Gaiellaceae bacterium]